MHSDFHSSFSGESIYQTLWLYGLPSPQYANDREIDRQTLSSFIYLWFLDVLKESKFICSFIILCAVNIVLKLVRSVAYRSLADCISERKLRFYPFLTLFAHYCSWMTGRRKSRDRRKIKEVRSTKEDFAFENLAFVRSKELIVSVSDEVVSSANVPSSESRRQTDDDVDIRPPPCSWDMNQELEQYNWLDQLGEFRRYKEMDPDGCFADDDYRMIVHPSMGVVILFLLDVGLVISVNSRIFKASASIRKKDPLVIFWCLLTVSKQHFGGASNTQR